MKHTAESVQELGAKWIARIEQAEAREKDWSDVAGRAQAAYLAEKDEPSPAWNIVASNVETIVPAVYNSTPRPDIRSRHDMKDPVIEEAADVLERAIMMAIDDGRLDVVMEKSAQDAFLAGRGVLRLKFEADETDQEMVEPDGTVTPIMANERIDFHIVSWRDYREGPAKKWKDVPWVAYRSWISEIEADRVEDPELAALRDRSENAEAEEKDLALWQVWDKEKRSVILVLERGAKVLSITPDPLNLTGFFPQPEPLQPIGSTDSRLPVCPYAHYEKQADELNRITQRINGILKGMKVKGAVLGASQAVEEWASADENTLTSIADIEAVAAIGGLDKAISWWPIDKAMLALRELYTARDQVKNSIYEITGISDIIRGQSYASESATAQKIKTEWGSLRVKKMQRGIERQVRDIFGLCAEIMAQHFSPETLAKMAGMQISPQAAMVLTRPLDHYRIDVESDSTVRGDTQHRREEMARFLEGTAQFFQVMAPLVAQGPQAGAPIAKIYGAFTTQFNLGKTAEDAVDELIMLAEQMSQGGPQGQDDEKKAMQAEMAMKQAELQGRQQAEQGKLQLDAQKLELERQKLRLEAEKLQIEREKLSLDAALKSGDLEIKRMETAGGMRDVFAEIMTPLSAGMEANRGDSAAVLQAMQEQTRTLLAAIESGNQAVLQVMRAPKRIVRDAAGKAQGVEMVNGA